MCVCANVLQLVSKSNMYQMLRRNYKLSETKQTWSSAQCAQFTRRTNQNIWRALQTKFALAVPFPLAFAFFQEHRNTWQLSAENSNSKDSGRTYGHRLKQ